MNRGKKTADYAVLRMTNMTGILTEKLFIFNPKDAQSLKCIKCLKGFTNFYAERVAKFRGIKSTSDTLQPVQESRIKKQETLLNH
ncbi:N-acetylmuramoyl-L-alanine amidase [Priestia megaterium]|uniref:N-acetylmuramoyl-L-alanine amidase n=1 Tax=Priestia megaterium TaxID=1404 RepID=UPI001EDB5EA9|nr:N-acetylmuramoyl-L-alanine amidase [Priestia megaterium]